MTINADTSPVEIVKMPGVTRVVLSGAALAMLAEVLEDAADAARFVTKARRINRLAEAIRASDAVDVDMPDDGLAIPRNIARDLHDAWRNA